MTKERLTRLIRGGAEKYSDTQRVDKPAKHEKKTKTCGLQNGVETSKAVNKVVESPSIDNAGSSMPHSVIASDIDALYEIIHSGKVDKTRLDAATSLLKLIEDEQHINHETIAELYAAETDVKVAATLKRALNKLQIRSRLSSDPTQPYDRKLSKTEQENLQLEIDRLRKVYDQFHNSKGEFERKYEIKGEIGKGGMARILKAIRREDNRPVAIKYLLLNNLSRQADPERLIKRFQREGELLIRRLNHAHIVKGYEYGEKGGEHFIILEYVAGGNLEELIKEKALSFLLFKMIALQLCDVVGYLHREGIIHRDIKPSNVLIDNKQTNAGASISEHAVNIKENVSVKLADFGLAKDKRDARLTQFFFSAWTEDYSSPQQMSDARNADERDDIYSLGKTFYEMLTGQCQKNDEPYLPVALPEINRSEAVNNLILKCIAQERQNRWQNIAELETAMMQIK